MIPHQEFETELEHGALEEMPVDFPMGELWEAKDVYTEMRLVADAAPRYMALCCMSKVLGEMLSTLPMATRVKMLGEVLTEASSHETYQPPQPHVPRA